MILGILDILDLWPCHVGSRHIIGTYATIADWHDGAVHESRSLGAENRKRVAFGKPQLEWVISRVYIGDQC